MCVPGGSVLRAPVPHDTRIQKKIFLGCTYTMGFNWQPHTLLSLMGGVLTLHHLHLLLAPLFRCFGVLMWGLYYPPLLLLVIVEGLHATPFIFLVFVVDLPSSPLLLGL